MTPRFQKFALVAHIAFSVGWFGAIVPYLALVIAGLTSHDAQLARTAFLSLDLIGWYVIVPFSLAALLSGLLLSLITHWGLFRHWWILAKLALTVFAVVVLFQHMRGVTRLAQMARETALAGGQLRSDLLHATGGLMVLLAIMLISVFKPWGMTSYGRRRAAQGSQPPRTVAARAPIHGPESANGRAAWSRIVKIHVAHAVVLALLFAAVMHITGLHHH